MKTVFLDKGSFPDWIEFPPEIQNWSVFNETTADQCLARVQNAEIIVTNKVILDTALLQQLPNLKMIAITATGTNNVDLNYCKNYGVAVANVAGYAANTVAEHMIALLFALRRNLSAYRHSVIDQHWTNSPHFCHFAAPITDLAGSTICIIGSGAIGQNLAKKCEALGLKIIFADDRKQHIDGYLSIDEALQVSDQVALCCPLTPETQNMIDKNRLAIMKPSAILINCSRGGLVNEEDLLHAMKNQTIAGVALDVSNTEPLLSNSPLQNLLHYQNVILTPHIAWGSDIAINKLIAGVMSNIKIFNLGGGHEFLVPPPGL